MEQTNKQTRIKILTNSGYKYVGFLIEKNSLFVIMIDDRQGKIEVPLANISLLQEVGIYGDEVQ